MLKTNKVMCILLLLAFTIIVIGLNSANATNLNSTENIEKSIESTDNYYADNFVEEVHKEKNIVKTAKNSTKKSPELEDISLHMDDVEVDYGEVADLNVITTPEVDEGILAWYIRGGLVGARNLSISASSYQLNTYDYTPGNYSVEVTYTGSLLHKTNSTTANLIINPIDSYISNFRTEFDENNDILVNLNVFGGNDIIPYGYLNVYQQNNLIKSIEIEDEDACFSLDKTYNQEVISIEYVGDEYYRTSTSNFLVNVPKYSINMYMPNTYAYVGSNFNESVSFYTNHPVNDGILDVYVDGLLVEEYDINTSSIDVTFSLENYGAGVYDVYLDYFGSDVYNDVSYQSSLNVKKVKTTLYAYNVTGHKNESVSLRANVYNYVDETNEGMVEFFIDNESIKTLWLYNTSVDVDYTIPDSLSYALHELKVVYYGSNRYDGDEKIVYMNVTRYPNTLSIRNYSLDDDGRIVIDVRSYSYKQDVDDGRILCYVDDELIGSFPVSGNVTSIHLPEEFVGDMAYNVKVVYCDSDKFEDCVRTETIYPNKTNTSVRLYTYANTNNTLNITSYVYASDYSNISEGCVKFYLNDSLIGTSNVSNNQANIMLDMNEYVENTYNITAIYNGTRLYKASENKTNINYTRRKENIYLETIYSISKKPTETINLNINLTDYNHNKVPVNTSATITIFDTEYAINVENGQINFEYQIPSKTPVGTYNITIKTDATKDYKNTTGTVRINIYKDTPYITSQNIRANKGETIYINATLNLNREILNKNITGILKINNKTVYQGIFLNGAFQYRLVLSDKYKDNTYNITIKSKETSLYNSAEKSITLNLNSRNTYIISQNIESKNGEEIIINASVYDSITGKTIKGTSKACIKINDVTLDNIIIRNGQLLYAYNNDYSAKDYDIKIIHGENGIYSGSTWNGTLTVKSSKLKIATQNIQTTAYSTVSIKANILDQNKPAQAIVKTAVKINNKTIHEENITNGKIEFNYTLPDEIGSGTYNITIIAGDSRKYTGNTTTVKLQVNKNYKEIQINNITTTENTLKIKAKIVDLYNNTITKNTKINIKLGGHTLSDYNITDGNIDYTYSIPENYKKGNYDLLIQAGESSGYYHASSISTVKIE